MLTNYSPKKIGWPPYIYLIYLVFLFFQPFFDPEGGWQDFILIAALIVAFIPMYFWTGAQRTWRAFIGLAGICSLGFLAMFVNSGATVFFIYAAALAGVVARFKIALRILIAIMAVVLLATFVSPIPMPFRIWTFVPALVLVPMIGFLQIYESERERSRAKLELANEEIEHLATIAERERIARDLHDLLGHTLSVITLKSELASKLIDKDVLKAKAEMQEVERISRETLAEVRSAVSGYRQKGFMAELATAKLALESAGVSFAFKGMTDSLTVLQESTLSLVVREAVTNIIRHANASRCFIELKEDPEALELEISDNGVGMQRIMGNGLSGIHERVTLLGGRFELSAVQGTSLSIHLPKDEALKARASSLNMELEPS